MTPSTAPLRRLVIRLATVVAMVVATLAATLAVALPAQARSATAGEGYVRLDDTCTGLGFTNRVRNQQVASGLTLRVYYSSSQGGTNCVNLVNTSGRTRDIGVVVFADGGRSYALDEGRYSSFAGSVLVKDVAGECIDLQWRFDGSWRPRIFDQHCG